MLIWFAIVVLFVILVILAGKLGWFMTEVPEGSMKFVKAGEDYVRTILNIKNKTMVRKFDPATGVEEEVIETGFNPLSLSPLRVFGFHWISWMWPLRRLHRFSLTTNILITETEQGQKKLHEWVQTKPHDNTDRLGLMIRSYFFLKGVELKGQFKVDVVVFALMEIVNPRLAVFVYNADFVKILGPAILSGYADNAKTKDIVQFTNLKKGRGSKFAQDVCEYVNTGRRSKVATEKIENVYGVRLVETFVYEFDQADADPEALKAAQAQKVAELQAKATITRATGQAEARVIEANAKATELSSNVKALVEVGVDPNEAMRSYATIRSTENVPNLQTWVQGGGVVPTVSVGNPTSPSPSSKNKPKETPS
ncbi:MAG: hypothetical protein AAB458_00840 [Patescibacteria group bacterium]